MASTIGTAYVQIAPSAKGISGSISAALGGEATAAGKAAGSSIVGALKGVIAAAGIGKMLKDTLMEGANLQQSIGGVETLFKDNADVVKRYAEDAYKTAGLSANQYMEAVTSFSASLLQGLGGDTAAAAESANMAITDMSDNWNKFGTDSQSVMNAYQGFAKQNYTMLDNLKLGYGGTKAEMERLLADAEKLTGVKYDISNLDDVYHAIHAIQEDLGVTGTTALEAAETFSGSFASMKSAAQNLMGQLALGEDIMPALTALGETVQTFLVGNLFPMIGNVLTGLPEIIKGALAGIVSALNIVAENADMILQQGIDFVTQLVLGIAQAIPALLEAAANLLVAFGEALMSADWGQIATDLINGLKEAMDTASSTVFAESNIVDMISDGIQNKLPLVLEKGVEIIGSVADGILKNIPTAITAIGNVLSQLLQWIMQSLPEFLAKGVELIGHMAKGIIQNLPEIVAAIVNVITQLIATLLSNMPQFLAKGIEIITNVATGILNNLPTIISAITTIITNLIQTIAQNFPQFLAKGIELIGQVASGIINAIPQVLNAARQCVQNAADAFRNHDWGSVGRGIIDGIKNGISAGASAIASAARSAAQSALNAAKSFLGINSPSKVFREQVGMGISEGIAYGITDEVKTVQNAVREITDKASADFNVNGRIEASGQSQSAPGSITINVYGAEGQDERVLAKKIEEIMAFRIAQRGAVFA